jgi:RNA methyltransferase, TrmH family
MTITSPHNERLKEVRRLARSRRAREESGRFVAEGEDLLGAADAWGWVAVERYVAVGSGLPGVEVEPSVLARVSGLGSGTRALGVYSERWAARAFGPLCVYLHGVADPGNVGAVLRSAEAFGASCVAVGVGTADPFGPKAVRASMGAIFSVPVVRTAALEDLPGVKVALVAGAGVALRELWPAGSEGSSSRDKVRSAGGAGPPEAITLLIGAERAGLPDELVAQADHTAHIPILSQSINAAMAATVALYELAHRIPRA